MIRKFILAAALAVAAFSAAAAGGGSVLDLLDLSRQGLEQVRTKASSGDEEGALAALLQYYRNRTGIVCPGIDPSGADITAEEKKWADDAMEHRFFVHRGYQPSFFYGDDIDWQYWPVHDNELRWQLHRTKWWVPLGKAYRTSGDEKYAKEWTSEYLDWMRKNPLGAYDEKKRGPLETADNMYFAWRPLEVSDRLELQVHQFLLFLPSEYFTPAFLSSFLENYERHCTHMIANFSEKGNHLLFEAQRLLYASVFFPEFKDAASWRQLAIGILNREIGLQVYDDGQQYELDPHYHLESIDIFFKALRICDANGYRTEFPQEYIETVHRMITVTMNIDAPDRTTPLFSDCRFIDPSIMRGHWNEWREVFPDDAAIAWMASEGREGSAPETLSRAFSTGGFYCLRNGWTEDATLMVLKAGPKAFWHCQPDNGTFTYWRKGRDFLPDTGCYVYGGDKSIEELRKWYRQTCKHNTLTLDNRNLETTDSKLLYWKEGKGGDVKFAVRNESYAGLTHTRMVHFHKDGRVDITDVASGSAEGEVAIHFGLIENEILEDAAKHSIRTLFPDGNNIEIRVKSNAKDLEMVKEEGRISRFYRETNDRPAYGFRGRKTSGQTIIFKTVLKPVR